MLRGRVVVPRLARPTLCRTRRVSFPLRLGHHSCASRRWFLSNPMSQSIPDFAILAAAPTDVPLRDTLASQLQARGASIASDLGEARTVVLCGDNVAEALTAWPASRSLSSGFLVVFARRDRVVSGAAESHPQLAGVAFLAAADCQTWSARHPAVGSVWTGPVDTAGAAPHAAACFHTWIQGLRDGHAALAENPALELLRQSHRLRREAAIQFHRAEELETRRFAPAHVLEVLARAKTVFPGAARFLVTDTRWDFHDDGLETLADADDARDRPGKKVFIIAFESDDAMVAQLAKVNAMRDAAYLTPRVIFPPARYFHRNRIAWDVLRAEAALPQPKFTLGDFENLLQALESTRHVPGDFLEVGVFQGRSAHCVLHYMQRAGLKRRAYLLDTFEGFNYEEAKTSKDAYWLDTHGDTSIERVRQFVSGFSDVVVERSNIITDSLPDGSGPFAVANIDVDMYEAVLVALQKIVPRLSPGGIAIVEDQGHTPFLGGAYLAVHEFLATPAARGLTPVHLPSGQMFLVKAGS